MKSITYIPLAILAMAIAAAVGYFIGNQNDAPTQPASDSPATHEVSGEQARNSDSRNDNNNTNTMNKTPTKRAVTPDAIAKAKNVPATLENPQGDFTLVAVVEGAEANRRLNQSLQVVGAQRQRLDSLSRQFDQTPAESVQQRELIAGQINETRKTLEGNLRFMAQNYAYSLSNNYVLVPHEAQLLSVTNEDGRAKTEVVHEFKDAVSYEDFQKKRDTYLRLKLEQTKAAEESAKAGKDATPVPVLVGGAEATPVASSADVGAAEADAAAGTPSQPEPTAEMEAKREQMEQLFNYNPEKNYQIHFEKTALYARAAG